MESEPILNKEQVAEIFGEKAHIQNFVISVRNVRLSDSLSNTSNTSNTSNILTNLTFSYKDLFEKDNQPNRIKYILYHLHSVNNDFNGLSQKQIADYVGIDNIKGMTTILQRMKVAGDIKLSNNLSNKVSNNYLTKSENCYILTENARNDITELIEILTKEQLEQEQKEIEKQNYKEQLEQSFFNLKEQFGENNNQLWEIKDQSIIIDFPKLAEINPKLADLILEDYYRTSQVIKYHLGELSLDCFKDKEVRIKNLPESCNNKCNKINSSHLEKPFEFDVEVVSSTQIKYATTNIKYECPSCGTFISVLQLDKKIREPSRCSCGRRGGFKEISKDKVDHRILLCCDNPESFEDNSQGRTKRFFLKGDIANIDDSLIQSSSKLKIVGIPIADESSGETTGEIDIDVIYIEPKDELLVLNFSDNDKQEFKEFSKSKPLETIKKEVYDLSVCGYDSVKKGLILQQVGGVSKQLNNGAYKRGEIHILEVGDPGTSKSVLAGISERLSVRCVKMDSNRGTSAGLTGTFEYNQQLGQKVRMPGALDKAKGGLLKWEEFNEADISVQATLKTPLESSEYSVNLATGQLNKRCPFAFLPTMNPKNGNYLDITQPILSQIPLNPALKTRFDLIFGGFIKSKDINEVGKILEKQDLNEDIPKERFNFFKKYLAYCKIQKTEIPQDVKTLINGFCSGFIVNSPATFRIKDTLNRLVEAFAKIELREEANKDDFENAKDLFLESLKSTSIKKDEPDLDRFVETSTKDLEDIKKIEYAYNKTKDKDGNCLINNLFKESGLISSRFSYILHLMFNRNLIEKDKLIQSGVLE